MIPRKDGQQLSGCGWQVGAVVPKWWNPRYVPVESSFDRSAQRRFPVGLVGVYRLSA
jgi:hypothetical protein